MDQGTIKRIYELKKDGHPNAIPIFGGAAFAYEIIHQDIPNISEFIDYILSAIELSHFWGYSDDKWVAKMFCHLCLVDPMLYGIR